MNWDAKWLAMDSVDTLVGKFVEVTVLIKMQLDVYTHKEKWRTD